MKTIIYSLLTVLSISTISCKKDNPLENIEANTVSATDNSFSENIFDQIFNTSTNSLDNQQNINSGTFQSRINYWGECVTYTLNTNNKTLKADFGNGCTGLDGITRSGIIDMTYTDLYRTEGSIVTYNLVNFYVNGYKVEGTGNVENLGRNAQSQLMHRNTLTNGKIHDVNGNWIIDWETTRTRTWISGEDTPLDITNDQYEISLTNSGINRNGDTYLTETTSPLFIDFTCAYLFTSGLFEISSNGEQPVIINYGDKTCDNNAIITYGDFTQNINIR